MDGSRKYKTAILYFLGWMDGLFSQIFNPCGCIETEILIEILVVLEVCGCSIVFEQFLMTLYKQEKTSFFR